MTTFKSLRWAALAGFGVIVLAMGMMGASVAGPDQRPERGERGEGRQGKGAERIAALADDLDLSAEQKAYFDEVQEFKKAKRQAKRAARGGNSLLDDMSAGGIDARTVHSSIDERFEMARSNAHAAADAKIAFLNSLDDGQLAMLAEKRAERIERKKAKKARKGKGKRAKRGPGGGQGASAQ